MTHCYLVSLADVFTLVRRRSEELFAARHSAGVVVEDVRWQAMCQQVALHDAPLGRQLVVEEATLEAAQVHTAHHMAADMGSDACNSVTHVTICNQH